MDLSQRENWVGVIGSREATAAELQRAYDYAFEQASLGYTIVSGLANGVDTKAHEGALDAGGLTLAIVNTPPEQAVYPKENTDLAKRIIAQGGIVYPFENKANPILEEGMYLSQFKRRLLERDLLLARLTPKIVAVCDEEVIKGGTRYAVSYGKKFNQQVYRLDSKGNFFLNPKTLSAKISWKTEIKNLLSPSGGQ